MGSVEELVAETERRIARVRDQIPAEARAWLPKRRPRTPRDYEVLGAVVDVTAAKALVEELDAFVQRRARIMESLERAHAASGEGGPRAPARLGTHDIIEGPRLRETLTTQRGLRELAGEAKARGLWEAAIEAYLSPSAAEDPAAERRLGELLDGTTLRRAREARDLTLRCFYVPLQLEDMRGLCDAPCDFGDARALRDLGMDVISFPTEDRARIVCYDARDLGRFLVAQAVQLYGREVGVAAVPMDPENLATALDAIGARLGPLERALAMPLGEIAVARRAEDLNDAAAPPRATAMRADAATLARVAQWIRGAAALRAVVARSDPKDAELLVELSEQIVPDAAPSASTSAWLRAHLAPWLSEAVVDTMASGLQWIYSWIPWLAENHRTISLLRIGTGILTRTVLYGTSAAAAAGVEATGSLGSPWLKDILLMALGPALIQVLSTTAAAATLTEDLGIAWLVGSAVPKSVRAFARAWLATFPTDLVAKLRSGTADYFLTQIWNFMTVAGPEILVTSSGGFFVGGPMGAAAGALGGVAMGARKFFGDKNAAEEAVDYMKTLKNYVVWPVMQRIVGVFTGATSWDWVPDEARGALPSVSNASELLRSLLRWDVASLSTWLVLAYGPYILSMAAIVAAGFTLSPLKPLQLAPFIYNIATKLLGYEDPDKARAEGKIARGLRALQGSYQFAFALIAIVQMVYELGGGRA